MYDHSQWLCCAVSPLLVRGSSISFKEGKNCICCLNLVIEVVIYAPSWCSQISFSFVNFQIPHDSSRFRDFHVMLLQQHTGLCYRFNADACRTLHKKCNILLFWAPTDNQLSIFQACNLTVEHKSTVEAKNNILWLKKKKGSLRHSEPFLSILWRVHLRVT